MLHLRSFLENVDVLIHFGALLFENGMVHCVPSPARFVVFK